MSDNIKMASAPKGTKLKWVLIPGKIKMIGGSSYIQLETEKDIDEMIKWLRFARSSMFGPKVEKVD